MKKYIQSDRASLRHKAEEMAKKKFSPGELALSSSETLKLIQELEVRQIEVEMLDDELKAAKERAENAVKKSVELYDFAPHGYLTLDENGKIIELNFHASLMLGLKRSDLTDTLFSFFIPDETKPDFNFFLSQIGRAHV